jgi:nucleoside-diphosphate-sugar epimerase
MDHILVITGWQETTMTKTVLVLGSNGNFGSHAAKAFAAAGWTVRTYRRGTDMVAAAKGADVIVNGLNPPGYHDWATLIPKYTADVIAAAKASGATVVVPGNVYVYGDQPGPWDEDTPHRPVSRKGRVRAEMEATYRSAAQDGVRTIIVRGGDFIDPERDSTILRMVVLKGLTKGRITAMGDPDAPRAHAYLPDMARVVVALAERRDTLAAFEDVPFPGYAVSTNDIARIIGKATGRMPKVAQFGWWMMTALSPFWELAREMREMRYLYATTNTMSGDKLARLLPGFVQTPVETVIAAHMRPSGQRDGHPNQAMA